ncbi:hydroxymethylglutaryl-CoA lyase [Pseudomonas coleopterorum]|uniref:hydroxymethylglutaryl-CoA lyase n=1 Tax=Pseudomonas coleopterorum TaxID=1605838 RepID=UPI000B884951|nr:hydroxymethylglutaryl-CoA lyase [Pseudomonas coleopterorum]
MMLPERVRIVEVGPRDGLQNEQGQVRAEDKVALVDALVAAGLKHVEVGSFVSPRWVPQMADSAAVFAAIERAPGVTYAALTPNLQGLEAAIAAGASEVAVFAAASESFSQRNINCSIAQSLQRFEPVLAAAVAHGIKVRGYVSCVLGCPYEGDIAPERVRDVADAMLQMGCYELSLGDTLGIGTPGAARRLIDTVAQQVPRGQLAGHFHDTYGQAVANIYACLLEGVQVFDSSVAGLGGCPYAPGASGNVATEDVLYLLHGLGISTGVDLDRVVQAGQAIMLALGRQSASRVARARIGGAGAR